MNTDERTIGQRTRERILEAALPLFADAGFAGTSVRKIGAAAQVNVATLAYHFEDKAGLYRAVIERLYEELSQVDIASALSGADPVYAISAAAWDFAKDHELHIRLMHRHLLDRGSYHEVFHDTWVEPLMTRADPLFELIRPDWSRMQRRMLLFGALHLTVRMVLEDRDRLGEILAIEGDVDAAIVDWIANLIKAQLAA